MSRLTTAAYCEYLFRRQSLVNYYLLLFIIVNRTRGTLRKTKYKSTISKTTASYNVSRCAYVRDDVVNLTMGKQTRIITM